MSYSKEQRAARAAALAEPRQPEAEPPVDRRAARSTVTMVKDGVEAEVNNNASVQIMEAQGWTLKG